MRMFSLFRLLLLLGCFSVASSLRAEVFYWMLQGSSERHDSAVSACDYAWANLPPSNARDPRSITFSSGGTSATCYSAKGASDVMSYAYGIINRGGTTCPESSTYNLETGGCDAPPPDPCEEKAGQTQNFFANTPPGQSSLPGEYVCINSCRAAWSGECGANDSGASACWGLATFTGAQCQSGDTPGGPPPSTDDPDAPSCPDGYSWSGTTCVPTVPEDPEEPCEGPDCGDPDTPDEPCEGDDCPPPCEGEDCPDDGGDGDGGDGGDGDGGDGGDTPTPCDPATDPNQCVGSSVTGDQDCKAELNCKGDAIQCAILRTQKMQACQFRWDAQIEAQVAAAVSGPQFELEEKTIPVANLFNEAVSKGRWLNSTCPAPRNLTVMGKSIELSFEPICDFATALGPLIVAFASIAFAMIIGKGLKGN